MFISSPAFNRNAQLPVAFTCQGMGVAPPINWGNPPPATKSIAILLDDPDAPRTFTHWLVYNITPAVESLQRGGALPPGALAGFNSAGTTTYFAPCPPAGTHHYVFHVYALDIVLPRKVLTTQQFLAAVQGHIVGYGEDVAQFAKITRPTS
jgi:Raf kinase inhibitor-like YbhB/YbcL family protein